METGTTVLDVQKKYGSRALVLAIGAGLLFLGLGQKDVCRGLVLGGVFSAINFALMGQLLRYRLADNRKAAAQRSFAALMLRYLLLAVPPHRAPAVVREAGLPGPSGWIPVDPRTLQTKFAGVFAVGDVTAIPLSNGGALPKAEALALDVDHNHSDGPTQCRPQEPATRILHRRGPEAHRPAGATASVRSHR